MKVLPRSIFSHFLALILAFFTADMAYGAEKEAVDSDSEKGKPSASSAAVTAAAVAAPTPAPAVSSGGGGAAISSSPAAAVVAALPPAPIVAAALSAAPGIVPAIFTGDDEGGSGSAAGSGKSKKPTPPATTKIAPPPPDPVPAVSTGRESAKHKYIAKLTRSTTATTGGGGSVPLARDTSGSDEDNVELGSEDEEVEIIEAGVSAIDLSSHAKHKVMHAHFATDPQPARSRSLGDATLFGSTALDESLAAAGGAGAGVSKSSISSGGSLTGPSYGRHSLGSRDFIKLKPSYSTLYDGLKFQIQHGPKESALSSPYDHHLVLTSYKHTKKKDENTARASLTFFAKNGTTHTKVIDNTFVSGNDHGSEEEIYGKTFFGKKGGASEEYKEFHEWLTNLLSKKFPDRDGLKEKDPSEFFRKNGQHYHHTEIWILWYIRKNLTTWIKELGADFGLEGINVNIYTLLNPCIPCGTAMEEITQKLLEHDLPVIFSISSTIPHNSMHLPMPVLTKGNFGANPSYQIAYTKSEEVKSGTVKLTKSHGQCYHFWIPKLTGVTFSMDADNLLKATLANPGKSARPYTTEDLMNCLTDFFVHSHVPSRVRILDFNGRVMVPSAAVGVLKSTTGSVTPFNPISKVPNILSYFTKLLVLDLRGALPFYVDPDADTHMTQPRQNLWTALRGLPLLTDLDLGSFQPTTTASTTAAGGAGAGAGAMIGRPSGPSVSNNITFAEFAFLLGVPAAAGAGAGGAAGAAPAVPFPSIQVLKFSGNRIFADPTDAAANTAGAILTTFINVTDRAKAPTTIDLSDNGKYMHVSAAQAGRTLAKVEHPTDIIF